MYVLDFLIKLLHFLKRSYYLGIYNEFNRQIGGGGERELIYFDFVFKFSRTHI